MKRIKKRFIVDLSYTDTHVVEGALSMMIRDAVRQRFADDDDITVDRVGLLNRILAMEAARKRRANEPLAIECQQEPVAWRWKPRGAEDWVVCDKLPEFEDDAEIVCEPLFTCADTSTDREGK